MLCYKRLVFGRVLLLYIQSHWAEHHKQWSKGPFKDTIQTFVNTNDVDATRKEGSMSKREFNELKAVCEVRVPSIFFCQEN